jgi:hypothetical protein
MTRLSTLLSGSANPVVWSVEDLAALWEAYEQRRAERAA